MAKPTSSRDRSKRTASKRPTSSKTRPVRSRASTANVTSAEGRTSTGSARVTSGGRVARATRTAAQRVKSSGYAADVRALKATAQKGGAAGRAAIKKLAQMGIRFAPQAAARVASAAPQAAGAAAGLTLGGALAASAGRKNQVQMSRYGALADKKAPVYKTPLNQEKTKTKPKPAASSQSTTSGMTPAQVKAAQDKANKARQEGKLSDIRGSQKPRVSAGSTGSRPASKPQGQSKDMGENYRRWAKANPELAKKVKKGQAGYEAIKGGQKPAAAKPKPKPKQDTAASRIEAARKSTPTKSKAKPQKFESLSEKRERRYGR